MRTKLDPYGCHKQVAMWFADKTYRTLVHRHDHTFIAADYCERKMVKADTLPLLADALMGWPSLAEPLPEQVHYNSRL